MAKMEKYNNIILEGDMFSQNDELLKMIRKLIKNNDDMTFEVNYDSVSLPKSFPTGYSIINIFIDFCKYNEQSIEWHKSNKSNFIFNIDSIDDIDKVELFRKKNNVAKNLIIYKINNFDVVKICLEKCIIDGHNIILVNEAMYDKESYN